MEEFLKPSQRAADPESLTDEERFMFRKLGLRMKAFLLLGNRSMLKPVLILEKFVQLLLRIVGFIFKSGQQKDIDNI